MDDIPIMSVSFYWTLLLPAENTMVYAAKHESWKPYFMLFYSFQIGGQVSLDKCSLNMKTYVTPPFGLCSLSSLSMCIWQPHISLVVQSFVQTMIFMSHGDISTSRDSYRSLFFLKILSIVYNIHCSSPISLNIPSLSISFLSCASPTEMTNWLTL